MDGNPVTPFILGVRSSAGRRRAAGARPVDLMTVWAVGLCLAGAGMIERLRSDLRDAVVSERPGW